MIELGLIESPRRSPGITLTSMAIKTGDSVRTPTGKGKVVRVWRDRKFRMLVTVDYYGVHGYWFTKTHYYERVSKID